MSSWGLRGIGGLSFAKAKDHRMGNGLYFSSGGVTGTRFDIGSVTNPSSSFDNIVTMLAAYGLQVVYFLSSGTIATTGNNGLKGNRLVGAGGFTSSEIIDPDGEDLDGCSLDKMIIGSTGAQKALGGTGVITAVQCAILNLTNMAGTYYTCGFFGTMELADANVLFFACGTQGTANAIFDMANVGAGKTVLFADYTGNIQLVNLTNAATINIHLANGSQLDIDSSCTDGTINVYGEGKPTNGDGGTTVNDYTVTTGVELLEHHFHNLERWLGAAAGWDGTNETDAADPTSLDEFTVTCGNDTWGTAVCILGTGDTPVVAGRKWFDLHKLLVTGASANVVWKVRLAWGASYAAAITAGTYSEVMFFPAGAFVDSGPILLIMDRVAAGAKLFANAHADGVDAQTLNFLIGLHEYSDDWAS